ncbi:transposase [Massilia sp. CMS3.1]|uniref:transposase n=1 Tax=Massilia sp. CMS3.1 TaxID=3373083 RepID=UPI003EE72D1B
MSGKRYTEKFKIAMVKQVEQSNHPAIKVAARLRISIHSLYAWTKRYGVPEVERKAINAQSDEMRRLKAELKRVTEERDIVKGRGVLCQDVRVSFIGAVLNSRENAFSCFGGDLTEFSTHRAESGRLEWLSVRFVAFMTSNEVLFALFFDCVRSVKAQLIGVSYNAGSGCFRVLLLSAPWKRHNRDSRTSSKALWK